MTAPKATPPLTEEKRREVFAALVAVQDGGAEPVASRAQVARQFGITVRQVEQAEREGLEADWPPL